MEQKYLGKCLFAILILASTSGVGCASLKSNLVVPSIESPLVAGETKKVNVSAGVRPGYSYQFTGDASRRPPVLTSPQIENYTSPFAALHVLTHEDIQIGAELHPLNIGIEPVGKWQFYGDKTEGLQMAASARMGVSQTTKNGDQNGEFGAGGYDWDGNAQGFSYSAGLSAGYIFKESIMIYGGSSYGGATAKGKINHKVSDNGTSPAAEYKMDDKGTTWVVGVGIEFGKRARVNLGIDYAEIDFEDAPLDARYIYSATVAF